MNRLSALPLVAVLLAACAHAGEITVESRPFTLEKSFGATALPDKDCVPLRLEPKGSSKFTIATLAEHGKQVAKGDMLIRCDTTVIDGQIAGIRRVLDSGAPPAADPEAAAARQRAQQALTELEADRALCGMKAPADGWFYHGLIENGRWIPATSLVKDGILPCNQPFATIIPVSTKLGWVAFLDEVSARSLAPGCTGVAILAGREDLEIPVKLVKLAAVPALDGTCRADLSVTWPKDFAPAPGITARIHLIAYHQAAAITVPNKSLAYGPQGWTVEVKLADGKTERRPVKRGRASQDATEILSGLEVGQVVIVP